MEANHKQTAVKSTGHKKIRYSRNVLVVTKYGK